MKHGNLKSFAMGVLVTVMVMGLALPAAASVGSKTAELFYNNIKIRLNGTELTPKDATGKEVEPFVIGGTTYLPVRAIGEALGLNVGWDGKTSTVILGNDAEYNQPAAWLGELEPFTGNATEKVVKNQQFDGKSTANSGDTFDRYYCETTSDGVSYLLKGQYKKFTGTCYLSQENKDAPLNYRLLVYADDTLIYTSATIKAGTTPIAFDIDLKNCNKLQLIRQYSGNDGKWINGFGGSAYFYIGNAALWTE